MDVEKLDRTDLQRISDFLHPLWMDTYSKMCVNGAVEAQYVFDRYITPGPLGEKMDKGYEYFFFRDNGKDVALLATAVHDVDTFEINKLYVVPEYRRKGVATGVMEYALEHGRNLHCARAFVISNSLNAPAIALYEKFGFVKTAEEHKEDEAGSYSISLLERSL